MHLDHHDLSHVIEVTPAFYDIDPMEIVWHGHYVKYLELGKKERSRPPELLASRLFLAGIVV